MTRFKRLFVKEIAKVDLWFVVRISPLPEKFPGDTNGDDQHKVDDSSFGRRWIE
jgi:hypothetical protein